MANIIKIIIRRLEQCDQILFAIGQHLIVENGKMLKNNLAIWSHWLVEKETGSIPLLYISG